MIEKWDKLLPQIEEIMIKSQYSLPEIKGALLNKEWTITLPFDHELIVYEGASVTFTQLCNIYELLHGDDRDFTETLRLDMLEVVDRLLLEYADDIAANETQRELLAEIERRPINVK